MNALRLLGVLVLAVFAAALLLGAAPPLTVESPDSAPYIDNAYHVIPAYTTLWYRLNYTGDHSQVVIRLTEGNKNALQFMVHKPEQMLEWWKNPSPVGRGSPQKDDLIWTGNAHEGGTWYVEVLNYNATPAVFRFEPLGKGILPDKPIVSAPPVIVVQSTEVTFTNTDPTRALEISGAQYVIPAKTTLWYSFSYPGDHSQVTVSLLRGAEEKLSFMVLTPEQRDKWWEATAIGWGSAYMNDLVWSSNSHVAGTYLVQVINDNAYAVAFHLQVQD